MITTSKNGYNSRCIVWNRGTGSRTSYSFPQNELFFDLPMSNVGDTVWLSGKNYVRRSTDNGKTWDIVFAFSADKQGFGKISVAPNGSLWFGYSQKDSTISDSSLMYRSLDNGINWEKIGFETNDIDEYAGSFSIGNIFPVPDSGLKTVLYIGSNQGVRDMGKFAFIVTDTTRIRDTATSVTEESSGIEALPGGWLYSPNPNPATTVLRADVRLYTGMSVQQCKLGLYDIRSGKLMYDATPELQRMAQSGGRTTIEIPTAGIPTGAYLLQLTTEKSIHTRKVVINR
jgi:hypothetical protein